RRTFPSPNTRELSAPATHQKRHRGSAEPPVPSDRLAPAEPRRRRLARQRARGQAVGGLDVVLAARGDVVGGVRVEDRRQVLDLAAAGSELELATAVALDPVFLAVLVELEERAQAAGAR